MALTKQTFLTLISIFGLLFCTVYARETFSSPRPRANVLSHASRIFGVRREGTSAPSIQKANASSKQLQAIVQKTDALIASIGDKPQKCLPQCKGDLVHATVHLKRCIERIKAETFWRLTDDIDKATMEIDKCRECFTRERTEYAEFKTYDGWYKGVSADAIKLLDPAVQEEHDKRDAKDALLQA